MSPLLGTSPLSTLVPRNSSAANGTDGIVVEVICAWPVSGQYGPGSRALYYVLVAACVVARKADWLRNACLAAALLFPAVAALHGIVLAALHVDGGVDMDIYGAFQLCSIGILAAPLTVKLSNTYFYGQGRNLIFIWTGLILAGLLSLTVEFLRTNTSECTSALAGVPLSPDPAQFPYSVDLSCGLTCNASIPFSPMRLGSANNNYVVPAPQLLKFGTVTLLSAACCIPAILSLFSMIFKIQEINWRKHFGMEVTETAPNDNDPLEGTNGATPAQMSSVESYIRWLLSAVEIPIFSAAVLFILIMGERNFSSPEVYYQTEPITSIGQWAPIAATVFAVLGSLYQLVATALEAERHPEPPKVEPHRCECHCTSRDNTSRHSVASTPSGVTTPHTITPIGVSPSEPPPSGHQSKKHDPGNRVRWASWVNAAMTRISTPAPEQFDDTEFRRGRATDFPEVPGESQRNDQLSEIRRVYSEAAQDVVPRLQRRPSATSSLNDSVSPRRSLDHRAQDRGPARSPTLPLPPSPGFLTPRPRNNTLPTEPASFELQRPPAPLRDRPTGEQFRRRRETAPTVSPPAVSSLRNYIFDAFNRPSPASQALDPPTIVVDHGTRAPSPEDTPPRTASPEQQ